MHTSLKVFLSFIILPKTGVCF